MKFFPAVAALLTLSCTIRADTPRDVPPHHWATAAVQSITGKKIMSPGADGKFHGEKPVTRYELAVTLQRFIAYIEAGQKPLSPPAPHPAATLPKNAPADAQVALTFLTANGFLPPTSPLLTKDGTKPVTAQELADAMAQVTIRLSDRSLPPLKN